MPPANIENVIGPIGDGEGGEVYGTNTDRDTLIQILGKRKKLTNDDRALLRRQKVAEGTSLTLDELKQEETANIHRVVRKFEEQLLNRVDNWMMRFKEYKNEKSFELLGGIFCDGFLILRLLELFSTQKEM